MLTKSQDPPISYSATTGSDCLAADDWQTPWHVAYCKPRQEKSLARDLISLGVSYFLPMVERVSTSGGRRRTALNPLFPSYLFFAAEEQERLAAVKTNRILHFLQVNEAEQQVLSRELESLEACLRTQPKEVELYNHLVKGQRVRITGGGMKDWEGIVEDASRPHKVWVGVSTLGGGVLVEVHGDLLAAH
ncbi:transcriptional activator RfaH [Posidoniimonas polymericola]|uniref:Transcriptional activator RfaH n=1 Tax=Posidoniimonas polymericola TaxID=2528002 RepID=A0A5C5YV30_9BACT|nr:UpxY family transcription antiterminator [Posidoniimonas polymericola]TWT78397.1 transcriptional activator RfaH [Posidoniimonas polymericola]